MSKKVITGATGNIGSKLVQELHKSGVAFTAGVSNPPKQAVDYPYEILNFADKASLVKAFDGADTVFVVLPITDQLMQFAHNVLDAAKEAGVGHIVRSSAAMADAQSKYPLLQAHGQIDEQLRESGINYTITCPSSFMQNFVSFLGYNIKQGQVYSSTGSGRSAWIDVNDIAAVNAAILENPLAYVNQTFTLTGSESFSLQDGLAQIANAIGKPIHFVDIPQEAANETMKQYGMSDTVIHMIASMEMATKDGVLAETTADTEKILGRAPITFAKFVQENKSAWM